MPEKSKNLSAFPGWGMIQSREPEATAIIRGSEEYPQISGMARFYQGAGGVLVAIEVKGLPQNGAECGGDFFGTHIHAGGECGPGIGEAFAQAMAHYNPGVCAHPYHAGDLPPLLGNRDGYALDVFVTDRFSVAEIVGKTLIIHRKADDFTTQPGGNAGARIACGAIKQWGL